MRMTSRERQICEILRQEPMISQEELAQRLGITRSSAAVHISNLIKKGIILGKGYVFNQNATCAVIGDCRLTTTVEIGNDTLISTRTGGFALMVCSGLHSLDLPTRVITCLGSDRTGDELLVQLQISGVDTGCVLRPGGKPTSQVVELIRNGEAEVFNSYPFARDMKELINTRWWLVADSDYLLVEPPYLEQVHRLVSQTEFGDKGAPLVGTCTRHEFPPEMAETADLAVVGVDDTRRWLENGGSGSKWPGSGILVVTDGCTSVMVRHGDEGFELNLLPAQRFSVHEELERFLAGLIYGISKGCQLRQAVRIAIGNAVNTL